jgi:modulator of FtsH protease
VDAAYDAAPWSDFAAGMAGAAAALAGLLFVAVSINIRTILGGRGIANRAAQSLIALTLPVFVSLVLLIPGQTEVALAIELLVISAVVVPSLGWLARPGTRAAEQPRSSWITTTVVPSMVVAGAPVVAAIGLLTESLGGLYWLPAAVALALLGGLVNAWVLLVEILR